MSTPPKFVTLTMYLFLYALLAAGCEERGPLTGKYLSESGKGSDAPVVSLKLDPNGQGAWATPEESIPFRWESDGRLLWLHTKTGGVIEGKTQGDSLQFYLPGAGNLTFKKMPGSQASKGD